MTFSAVLVFWSLAALTIISPGPDTILIIRNALNSGIRIGFITLWGIQAGLVGHTVLVIAGLAAIIKASPMIYAAIAWTGAVYLCFLAWQTLRAGQFHIDAARAEVTGKRAFTEAFITNITNPKVLILFLAMMPPFYEPDGWPAWLQFVTLSAIIIVTNVIWQSGLAVAADRARLFLNSPRVQRIMNIVLAIVLLCFAVLLVADTL